VLVRTAVYMLAAPLAAAPIATGAEGSPRSANSAREPGLFAYTTLNGGIFTVRADGTGNRKILRNADDPVWSPDGTRFAVRARRRLSRIMVGAPRRHGRSSDHQEGSPLLRNKKGSLQHTVRGG
jgi:hypothetical protein